jgi:hypothetical protein
MPDAIDKFSRHARIHVNAPIIGAFAIVPDDATDIEYLTRQIKASGAGNIAVVWFNNSESIETIEANKEYTWSIKRVKSTGTTASGIKGYV